jgi:hypothetical protein
MLLKDLVRSSERYSFGLARRSFLLQLSSRCGVSLIFLHQLRDPNLLGLQHRLTSALCILRHVFQFLLVFMLHPLQFHMCKTQRFSQLSYRALSPNSVRVGFVNTVIQCVRQLTSNNRGVFTTASLLLQQQLSVLCLRQDQGSIYLGSRGGQSYL